LKGIECSKVVSALDGPGKYIQGNMSIQGGNTVQGCYPFSSIETPTSLMSCNIYLIWQSQHADPGHLTILVSYGILDRSLQSIHPPMTS